MKYYIGMASRHVSPQAFLVLGGVWVIICLGVVSFSMATPSSGRGEDLDDPEAVIRLLVQANANRDLKAMRRYIGQDENVVGYTIGGRKYVGWSDFAKVMEEEFNTVEGLEISITDLQVWRRENVAWFAMELDYTRLVSTSRGPTKTTFPLRETGVLERQGGQWILVNWHESLQFPLQTLAQSSTPRTKLDPESSLASNETIQIDLSGEWEIQEEDKSYRATLDSRGNGTYTHQEGKIVTTGVSDRLWGGIWSQKGNDREGGFEVLLSEDFTKAQGVWWYTRVGNMRNIPPRQQGGTYIFTRLTPLPPSSP